MRELIALEQRHEGRRKGSETRVKGLQRRLSTKGIADEDCQKIDDLILSETRTRKADFCLDEVEQSERFQNLRNQDHFCEPARQARGRLWRKVEMDRRVCHTEVSSLGDDVRFVFSSKETHFLFFYNSSLLYTAPLLLSRCASRGQWKRIC